MVDPDVPFRDSPTDGEWVHWLVYDIPGNDVGKGKTLVEYRAPAPKPCPKADKLCLPEHRVTFILWEQPHGPLELQPEDVVRRAGSTEGRARYKARDFAARHRLGLQIGMNFYETYYGAPAAQPWWYVSDHKSLADVEHLIPHTVRPGSGKDEL